jgi:Prokaryotic E2 family E
MTGALIKLEEHCNELTELTGIEVELIEDLPARINIVLKKVQLPPGAYRRAESDVLFLTDYQYPTSALDMFWTEVDVIRADGTIPASADQIEQYAGRTWRRFSWHRNGIWDPTRNGVLDHYELMLDRLSRDARTAA